MAIYLRCPNCRSDQNIKEKICKKCGAKLPRQGKKYIVKVSYHGRSITKSIPNSLEVAREIEAKIKQELISGDYYDRSKQAKQEIKYSDFMEDKYFPYAKEKRSYKDEVGLWKNWIKDIIGNKKIINISSFDIEKIKKTMSAANKAPRTINYALAVVRHSLNKARDWGLFAKENPVDRVKKPTINNKRTRFLTYEEAEMLLNKLQRTNKQLYEMAFLSLYTGMRAGEIFNLKWQDVDFKNGIIYIRDPKNKADRVAYMTADIKEMLDSKFNKKAQQDDYIFKGVKGKKITEISKTFAITVNRLGLNDGITDKRNKVVFHTLRHTFASWLAIQGTPIYTIKELMGHKSLAMTERYSHLAPDTKREAIKKLKQIGNSKNVVKLPSRNS